MNRKPFISQNIMDMPDASCICIDSIGSIEETTYTYNCFSFKRRVMYRPFFKGTSVPGRHASVIGRNAYEIHLAKNSTSHSGVVLLLNPLYDHGTTVYRYLDSLDTYALTTPGGAHYSGMENEGDSTNYAIVVGDYWGGENGFIHVAKIGVFDGYSKHENLFSSHIPNLSYFHKIIVGKWSGLDAYVTLYSTDKYRYIIAVYAQIYYPDNLGYFEIREYIVNADHYDADHFDSDGLTSMLVYGNDLYITVGYYSEGKATVFMKTLPSDATHINAVDEFWCYNYCIVNVNQNPCLNIEQLTIFT